MRESIVHPLEPFFDRDSKILILGTMPSPKSRDPAFITDTRKTVSGVSWRLFFAKRYPKPIQIKRIFFGVITLPYGMF